MGTLHRPRCKDNVIYGVSHALVPTRYVESLARIARHQLDDGSLQCRGISLRRMTAAGQNPNTSLGVVRPVPPGADMVRESSPLVKLCHSA